jgi:hypothetical protein
LLVAVAVLLVLLDLVVVVVLVVIDAALLEKIQADYLLPKIS